MDKKQQDLLGEVHGRIVAGTFDELDVQNFLIMLRQRANPGSVQFELGSFVAHRGRDKGLIHTQIAKLRRKTIERGTADWSDSLQPVFSADEVADALDLSLKEYGLAPLSVERHVMVQIAMMSMLRYAPMIEKVNGKFQEIGTLDIKFAHDLMYLGGLIPLTAPTRVRGVGLMIFCTPNIVYPIGFSEASIRPDESIRISYVEGRARIEGLKPYEIHFGQRFAKMIVNHPPIEWQALLPAIQGLPIAEIREKRREFDVAATQDRIVTFRLQDGRVSFSGSPQNLAAGSTIREVARVAAERLDVPVFDDNNTAVSLDGSGAVCRTDKWMPPEMRRKR